MSADDPELDRADDLKRAWRPAAGGEHPGEDAWVALAEGAIADGDRARIAAHVVRCPACARVWKGIVALGPAPGTPGAGADVAGDELALRRVRPRRWVAAAAAAIAIAAAIAVVWRRDRGDGGGDDVVRGGDEVAAIAVVG